MRIAVIGAGNVGGGLGAALSRAGHSIVYGVRNASSDKVRAALGASPGSSVASPAEAVAGVDVVVFTLRPDAIAPTAAEMPSLDGVVLIDAMNRLGGDPAKSTSDDLLEVFPGARVVKAFNTIGFENLTTARERRSPAAMFVAGDDAEAKAIAMGLAAELGFRAEDAGSLSNAKPLEEMVKVWLALTQAHGRGIGFALSLG
jgi:predicted dinucleotide-binding enzyme